MYQPKYFVNDEFARCKPSCELSDMSERLMQMLDDAREICNFPFYVNSAYRSQAYELTKGRKGTSSHCKGLAVDLCCGSSFVRGKMLSALIKVGFTRIGIYPTFLHVDIDDSKINAIWINSNDVTRG